jgi:hypothetical protein
MHCGGEMSTLVSAVVIRSLAAQRQILDRELTIEERASHQSFCDNSEFLFLFALLNFENSRLLNCTRNILLQLYLTSKGSTLHMHPKPSNSMLQSYWAGGSSPTEHQPKHPIFARIAEQWCLRERHQACLGLGS